MGEWNISGGVRKHAPESQTATPRQPETLESTERDELVGKVQTMSVGGRWMRRMRRSPEADAMI